MGKAKSKFKALRRAILGAVFICCVAVYGWVNLVSSDVPITEKPLNIVGKWSHSGHGQGLFLAWEFHSDGTASVRVRKETAPGKRRDYTMKLEYKLIPGERLELRTFNLGAEGDVPDPISWGRGGAQDFAVDWYDDDTFGLVYLVDGVRTDAPFRLSRVR